MTKFSIIAVAAVASAVLAPVSAQAAVDMIALPDIATFDEYTQENVGQTFSGTGFVGMYEADRNGSDSFAHLFGLEDDTYSRTVAQIDITSFAGATINSAILSFDIIDGTDAGTFSVVGFGGDGALGWIWDAPAPLYGSTSGPVVGGSNSIDITSIFASAVANGEDWLNLHLVGSDGGFRWTYTSPNGDEANVRLTVVSDVNAVPEPASWAMMIGGFALAGFAMRRRQYLAIRFA